jgi:hypothetical protein
MLRPRRRKSACTARRRKIIGFHSGNAGDDLGRSRRDKDSRRIVGDATLDQPDLAELAGGLAEGGLLLQTRVDAPNERGPSMIASPSDGLQAIQIKIPLARIPSEPVARNAAPFLSRREARAVRSGEYEVDNIDFCFFCRAIVQPQTSRRGHGQAWILCHKMTPWSAAGQSAPRRGLHGKRLERAISIKTAFPTSFSRTRARARSRSGR